MNDKQKLIDILMDVLPAGNPWEGHVRDLVDHLIANGVTVRRWIPVTERLPEKDGDYLAWMGFQGRCKRLGFAKDGREICAYDFRNNGKNVWYDYDSEWGYISYYVTHWMPLPEPPKEVAE